MEAPAVVATYLGWGGWGFASVLGLAWADRMPDGGVLGQLRGGTARRGAGAPKLLGTAPLVGQLEAATRRHVGRQLRAARTHARALLLAARKQRRWQRGARRRHHRRRRRRAPARTRARARAAARCLHRAARGGCCGGGRCVEQSVHEELRHDRVPLARRVLAVAHEGWDGNLAVTHLPRAPLHRAPRHDRAAAPSGPSLRPLPPRPFTHPRAACARRGVCSAACARARRSVVQRGAARAWCGAAWRGVATESSSAALCDMSGTL